MKVLQFNSILIYLHSSSIKNIYFWLVDILICSRSTQKDNMLWIRHKNMLGKV